MDRTTGLSLVLALLIAYVFMNPIGGGPGPSPPATPPGTLPKLRGVQISPNNWRKTVGTTSFAIFIAQGYTSNDDFVKIKSYGLNCVEYQLWLSQLHKDPSEVDLLYVTTWVDQLVNWAEDNQIYHIITIDDVHDFETEKYGPYHMPSWMWMDLGVAKPTTVQQQAVIVRAFYDLENPKMDASRQRFVNTWKFLAERYKNHEYAIYGLVNEPLHHSYGGITSSEASRLGRHYSTFMTTVYDAVRGTGAQNPIFVDLTYMFIGDRYNHVFPIDRDITWEAHSYLSQTATNIDSFKASIDNHVSKIVTGFGKPLYIGEYGCYYSSPQYAENSINLVSQMVAYMKTKQLRGYGFYAWEYHEGEYADFTSNVFNADQSRRLFSVAGGV